MRLRRLLLRPESIAVRALVVDNPGVVTSRVASAFRPPYGATIPGGPPFGPPIWRIVGAGTSEHIVLTASSEFASPSLPIRSVEPIWSRLVFKGHAWPESEGTVIAGEIAVRTRWRGAAFLVAGPLLLGIVVPFLVLPSLPILAGAVVGFAAGGLALRRDQERALDAAPAVSKAIGDAAAGALPPAPLLPAWGHDQGMADGGASPER